MSPNYGKNASIDKNIPTTDMNLHNPKKSKTNKLSTILYK